MHCLRDPVPVLEGDDQHHGDYCKGNSHSLQSAQEPHAGQDRREDREVDGHCEVFKNEN
ncbi:hypothetical protein D3C85_1714910 [compost metagenome]